MRPYSKLANGAWKEKRCNDFNVRACKVDMPRAIATRITTILKRMPKDKTLGDLVAEGHRAWVAKYEDMGKACQEYLMAAINAAAGEQVIAKKVTAKPRVAGIARKSIVQQIRKKIEEPKWRVVKDEDGKTVSATLTMRSPTNVPDDLDAKLTDHLRQPNELAAKLASKYRVSQKSASVYTAHSSLKDVPIDPDHMFDDLNEVQLRNKCVTQMKQLWKLNKDNAALRREIAEIKDRLAKMAGL